MQSFTAFRLRFFRAGRREGRNNGFSRIREDKVSECKERISTSLRSVKHGVRCGVPSSASRRTVSAKYGRRFHRVTTLYLQVKTRSICLVTLGCVCTGSTQKEAVSEVETASLFSRNYRLFCNINKVYIGSCNDSRD